MRPVWIVWLVVAIVSVGMIAGTLAVIDDQMTAAQLFIIGIPAEVIICASVGVVIIPPAVALYLKIRKWLKDNIH